MSIKCPVKRYIKICTIYSILKVQITFSKTIKENAAPCFWDQQWLYNFYVVIIVNSGLWNKRLLTTDVSFLVWFHLVLSFTEELTLVGHSCASIFNVVNSLFVLTGVLYYFRPQYRKPTISPIVIHSLYIIILLCMYTQPVGQKKNASQTSRG